MFVNKIYFNDIVNKVIYIINTYILLSMSIGKLLKKKTCKLLPTLFCCNVCCVLVIVLTCESFFSYI